ncbi:MAG TPA: TetR/AcrR family transcriptional regulator [Bryobacteraceae bacterium]|jgi:AcrR family transcriptional regulator|nr:TetR/AcrR family transcriptional regulator [Bryobacteraceae bacterium]
MKTARGSKQRREREKEGLREQILDAARTLFVKEGYESVSIRKIADKIEYAPGTIYLYFHDKAEILDRICEETFAKLIVRMQAIKDDSAAPLDKLRRGLRAYIQFGLDNPNHYIVTFIQGKVNQEAQTVYQTAGPKAFACLRQGVQECIDAGALVSNDADELAQTLWAGIHGLTSVLITCTGFPFIEHHRLIDRMVETLVEGVRAKSDKS